MTNFVEDALKSKHELLRACTASRELALRQLFDSTVAFLQINNAGSDIGGVTAFLEANDISKDRFFDPSTLPAINSTTFPETAVAQSVDAKQRSQRSQKAVEDTRYETDNFLSEKDNGEDGRERLLQESTPATVLSQQTSKSPRLPDSETIEGSSKIHPSEVVKQTKDTHPNTLKPVHKGFDELSIRPSEALPLSADDVVSMDDPTVENLEPEQRLGGARIVHLPPKEVQERHWDNRDQVRAGNNEQETAGNDEILERTVHPHQDNNGLTPPNSGRNIYTSPDTKEGASASENEHDNILKSQMRISRAEAFAENPSTPDQQLRFEEAQSMKLSDAPSSTYPTHDGIMTASESMQAPTNLPSQFVHGDLDDGEPVIDISKPDNLRRAELEGQIHSIARPTPGLRDHMFPGMNGEASKDLTFSRRPPMRIDTGFPPASDTSKSTGASRPAATTATTSIAQSPAESATPSRSAILASSAQSPPERMTTRVSSGALRHKSVSEILGETPKATPTQADKSSQDAHKEDAGALQTPKSASSFTSPDPAVFKQRLNEIGNRERSSKLSTVVFAKKQPTSISRSSDIAQTQDLAVEEIPIEDRDYLLTLFAAQVSTSHKAQPLNTLLKSAHKTLTTSDHYTDFRERQDCRILSKIYEMQATNKWSLRQLERSVEPNRPVAHLDVLLGQMKWMRTDFREERKWKIAAAKYLAEACEDWVMSSAERRKSLQVKVRTVLQKPECDLQSAPTPDLVHSAGGDLSEATDDDFVDNTEGNAPAAIFSLPPDMFIFGLNKSPVSEKLLLELPLYQPHVEVQDAALHVTEFAPDAVWKKPIVPLSKYAQGKIVSRENCPPRKRSRHNYSDNDDSLSGSPFAFSHDFEHLQDAAHPEQEDVALFNPENKHIRDRIHAGHAFRPPSEHIMPSQHFFECRQPSQWTKEEDDELRRLVREYAYNWSLISTCLATPSMFSSGAERRTPWECFERWITLEGLPAEVSKINYFRAYNARLQAAARSYEAHQQALLQQSGNNAAQMPSRRRSTQPFSVDRRKNAKHIHLIDAMRKQAKKRETSLHKQQHVAGLAAMRKATEPPKARQPMHTPQEFSRLKHERQLKTEEVMRNNRLQWLQQQRANQSQRPGQQNGQQPYGVPPNRNVPPGAPNGGSPSTASPVPPSRGGTAEQNRVGPPMQRPTNGQPNGVLPTNAQGVPHAPMQSHVQMQMGQRVPPHMAADNMRVYQEANRLQAEQQAYLQRQRQQQHPQSNIPAGSPNMQNPSALPQNNPNMLASMQGRASPSVNGGPPPMGSSASPNMTQPQALSSGMTPAVNQISNAVKLRNPQASPEQLRNMTNEQLYLQTQQQAARQASQAAAGNPNTGAMIGSGNMGMQAHSPMQQHAIMANGASPMLNPQQYAHMMRTQQASQQRGGSAGAGGGMNGSRSATPLVQRTGSAQGGRGPSQSPRAGQVGMAGGQ